MNSAVNHLKTKAELKQKPGSLAEAEMETSHGHSLPHHPRPPPTPPPKYQTDKIFTRHCTSDWHKVTIIHIINTHKVANTSVKQSNDVIKEISKQTLW